MKILAAVDNKLATLLTLMPGVRAALDTIKPGQVISVTTPQE